MAHEEIVEATLQWCNARRAESGKAPLDKLPKGKRNDPLSCPCGKATGLAVGMRSFVPGELMDHGLDPDYHVEKSQLPVDVQEFVTWFDAGCLPEYDQNIK